jgi:uncharacterized protein
MAHPVTWFQISGKDGKKLLGFYRKAFGWRMQPTPGQPDFHMVERELDGISGGVGASMDGNSGVTVYVTVADVRAHMKKIQAAGGLPAMPPMELPGGMGWIAGFTDPAGNWVGLWAPGTAAKPPVKRAAVRKPKTKAKPPKAVAPKRKPVKRAAPKRKPVARAATKRGKKTRARRA